MAPPNDTDKILAAIQTVQVNLMNASDQILQAVQRMSATADKIATQQATDATTIAGLQTDVATAIAAAAISQQALDAVAALEAKIEALKK